MHLAVHVRDLRPVTAAATIVIVHEADTAAAERLKEMIEFMDAPPVMLAGADGWLDELGDRRLAAVFVNDDLGHEQVDRVIGDIRDYDPNTPIVLVKGAPAHA